MMLWPSDSRRSCSATSAAVPRRNSRRKTSDGFSSHGIKAPAPVHDRLRAPCCTFTPSVSDGNRVRCPIRSAANWSSEIVLRKPPSPGCGAAVRKQLSAGCPPSTSGCQTPLNTVKSCRGAPSGSRDRATACNRARHPSARGRTFAAAGRDCCRRPGSGAGPSPSSSARQNAGTIASSSGSPSTTPAARRNCRRDRDALPGDEDRRFG